MAKYKVFPKEALLVAAAIGSKRGYNRSLPEVALQQFGKEIEEGGNTMFPVKFSMTHEHIAGEQVDAHIRAVIQLDKYGEQIILDVDAELFDGLPVYDSETLEVAA